MKSKPGICSSILITLCIGALGIYINGCSKPCCTIGFVLKTDTISAITDSSARCGGTISSDDEDTVTARGVCWSTRQSPTVENDTTSDGIGVGKFTSVITGLTPNTLYFVRAYVTNRKGSAYGDEKSFKTKIAPVFTIGKTYGGGTIFYIDTTGVHGLITSSTDQNKTAVWGCSGVQIPGADGDSLGKGINNTNAINDVCKQPDIAAWICVQYISNDYTGWFLPSKDELDSLFLKKEVVGGFANDYYWSSTQSGTDSAWGMNFKTGLQIVRKKSDFAIVRAIRAF